jgi:Fe2+ transport system protein FeoA
MTVYDLKVGDDAIITDFLAGREFRRRLVSLGVTRDSRFTLKNVTIMRNVFELELVNGALVALRKGEAQKVKVQLCKKA